MTTSPYSDDLRKKVINYLSKGSTKKETAEVFGIHRNTVSRWSARYQKEGSYCARARLGRKSNIDHKEIELFVINNPDKKLRDIGDKFLISVEHTRRVLMKLGFSYKKKPLLTWRQTKKNETSIKRI